MNNIRLSLLSSIVSLVFCGSAFAGSAPHSSVKRILPMAYAGETGFMFTNCAVGGCITGSSCHNSEQFWVGQSNPLYQTFLSLATASMLTGTSVSITGTNGCTAGGGYEKISWMEVLPQ